LVTEYDYTDYNSTNKGPVVEIEDPTGSVQKITFDNLGRKIKIINNYDDGSVSSSEHDKDQTIEFGYGEADDQNNDHAPFRVITRKTTDTVIDFDPDPDTTSPQTQETKYVYGVSKGTISEGYSAIKSGKLLQKICYPDPSTGSASTDTEHQKSFAYDKYGRLVWQKDQSTASDSEDATVHEFTYDELDRLTKEDITSFRSDVDQSIEHIEQSYSNLGRVQSITTKNTSENVINQVVFEYNGFGQVVKSYQEHDGEQDDETTLSVVYDYTDDANSFLDTLTYPDGSVSGGVNSLHYQSIPLCFQNKFLPLAGW
jgi:YD repeat-containing protein